jgi:hypothetical protein
MAMAMSGGQSYASDRKADVDLDYVVRSEFGSASSSERSFEEGPGDGTEDETVAYWRMLVPVEQILLETSGWEEAVGMARLAPVSLARCFPYDDSRSAFQAPSEHTIRGLQVAAVAG